MLILSKSKIVYLFTLLLLPSIYRKKKTRISKWHSCLSIIRSIDLNELQFKRSQYKSINKINRLLMQNKKIKKDKIIDIYLYVMIIITDIPLSMIITARFYTINRYRKKLMRHFFTLMTNIIKLNLHN